MANYNCFSRTNYFRVNDEAKFRKIVDSIVSEGNVELFDDRDDGTFAFGAYGSITSKYDKPDDIDPEDEDYDYDMTDIFEDIQSILPDGEVCIIQEVGYEKLRYLTGYCFIITNKEIETINLSEIAKDTARQMLGDPNKVIELEY